MEFVTSNTTPIRYLTEINASHLLPFLFTKLIIPEAVAEELTHRHAPQVVRKLMDSDPKWLEVRTVKKKDSTLEILDPGEREAILLSEEIQSKIILLDDGQARQAAIKRNLACIGTLRILSEGANFDMIDLKESIGRLKQTTFRASAVLIHQVLDGAL